MFRRIARRAAVDLVPGSPIHTFRRTFARTNQDAGVDVLRLQRLMRHKSLAMTDLYTREHPGNLKDVHQRVWGQRKAASEDEIDAA